MIHFHLGGEAESIQHALTGPLGAIVLGHALPLVVEAFERLEILLLCEDDDEDDEMMMRYVESRADQNARKHRSRHVARRMSIGSKLEDDGLDMCAIVAAQAEFWHVLRYADTFVPNGAPKVPSITLKVTLGVFELYI